MKNILVIGAHGHVGRQVVPKLAQAGYHVLAGLRNKANFVEFEQFDHVDPVLFDLNATPEEMKNVYQEQHVDAIVFSAGSGGNTDDKQTLIIDLDGAIKTMIAARQAGVNRYVMVSAAGSDDRSFWPASGLHGYYIAKHYADDYLKTSQLDYTILRPTALSNDAETGKITVNPASLADTSIPRADVANVIVAVLNNEQTAKQVYQFTSGSTAIDQAFK